MNPVTARSLRRIGAADQPVYRARRELDRSAGRQADPLRAVGGEELCRAAAAQREVHLRAGQVKVRCPAALAVGCLRGVDPDLGQPDSCQKSRWNRMHDGSLLLS